MAKKEWCKHHNSSLCNVEGNTPSLAKLKEQSVPDQPEKIILTDQNLIMNFLLLHGQPYEAGQKLPKQIMVKIPKNKTIKYLLCTANNCKSKQRSCSHFE